MAIVKNSPYSQSSVTSGGVISSVAYTVPAGARSLYIFVYADTSNVSVVLPDLCDYAGVSATMVAQIPAEAGGTGQVQFVYKISSPATGSNTLRARHPTIHFFVAAFSVSSDNPLTETISAVTYANSASVSSSIASATGDETVFSITVNNVDTTAVTETGGQTVLSEGGSSVQSMHQLSSKTSAGTPNSTTWSVSSAQRWSAVAINLKENSASITTFNGGNPITAGQTGIAIEATGFSAKPTAVTATYASGAKSITATVDSGGTATNFNISIQDRIEDEDWPVNGDTITFTLTYLTESATGTQTLVKKASETVLTVLGGITIDPATWTYWLTQDGFTVEGGENVYDPYGDLVLTADGGGSATNAGTFTSWWRPSTGTGAGNVYAYTWVITEAGISLEGSGLTSSGLTSSGLTIAGLISSGL